MMHLNSIDLPTISYALGHSDTRTTLNYLRQINLKKILPRAFATLGLQGIQGYSDFEYKKNRENAEFISISSI